MEKAKKSFLRFTEKMKISSKAEMRWFVFAVVLLLIYTITVQFFQLFEYGLGTVLIYTVVSIIFCPILLMLLRKAEIKFINREYSKKHKSLIAFAIVFVVTFLVYFYWQRGFWPGSFSPDSLEQYGQALSGEYNDWHPVLHTWLFFGLPMLFSSSPAFIVTLQIIWFSLAVAYLYFVLYRSGCGRAFMLLSYIFVITNPNTALIMLFPWKDSALTIFATVIFAQVIRIYETKGEWLCKPQNLCSFTLFCFFANGVRHNAVLIIAPLILILYVFFKSARRRLIFSAVILIAATLILKLPIYSLAGVESPDRRQAETLGLPMTVLQNIYMEDRDALSEEAIEFMDSLATQENWEKYHQFSNFNSIKWSDGEISYKIEEEGAGKILKYTIQGAANSPKVALRSVIALTSMVWSVDGGSGWGIWPSITKNELGIEPAYDEEKRDALLSYRQITSSYATRYLFNFVGVIILLLLFSAVAKIGSGGLKKAFAVIPLICYNFGTMLLLTGHDFRFFHLNFVIVIPLLYILFSAEKEN